MTGLIASWAHVDDDIAYHWVIPFKDQRDWWLVVDYDGRACRMLDGTDMRVTPDLNEGEPVIRRIPLGIVAQYFRFERLDRALP